MADSSRPTPPTDPESKGVDHEDNVVWTQVFYGREVMERILATISTKQALVYYFQLRYVMRAAMAGVICILMYVFCYQLQTELGPEFNPGLTHLFGAMAFGFALPLIYFTNSELLTSNFMYFTVGVYYRRAKIHHALYILGSCLMGNLLGILVIAVLMFSAGILDDQVVAKIMHSVETKTTGRTAWEIFVRAIFANYFINISVIIAMQLKDAWSKMVALTVGVIVFAFMGYEHVIANSALFALAILHEPEAVNYAHMAKNFLCALLGNYVGGGLVIGLFYAYLNDNRATGSRVAT